MQIEILHADALRAWCRRIGMPDGATEALETTRSRVLADPQLLVIFEMFYEKTAVRGEWEREWKPLPFDPLVSERLGQDASLFYLLAYLAALPLTWSAYQQRGLDDEIFCSTLLDIPLLTEQAHDVHGYWRFDHFQWIWRHLAAELFRLGRLQFILSDFYGHVTALRRASDGQIRLLADPNTALRSDGYALGAGKWGEKPPPVNEENGWQPVFEEHADGWLGHPVSPYGYALREPAFYPRAEWALALQHGDTILDLHIPRASSLSVDDCRESFRRAFTFFPQQFPERPFRAVFCHTWLFSPQLQAIQSPNGGIVRFQREFYLYPSPGGPAFLWSFVFGEKYPDPAGAPRDTHLRRAVLDRLANGQEIFDLPGLMFHSPDEYGSQPYMTHWDQTHSTREAA